MTSLPQLKGRMLRLRGAALNTYVKGGKGHGHIEGHASIEETSDAVVVSVRAQGFWFTRSEVALELPPHVHLQVRAEAGNLYVERAQDLTLDCETHRGSIYLERVTGRVRVRTKSGSIHVERLAGGFDLETMAGAIHLEVDDLVAGSHHARTYAGALHADFADHIEARIDARATMGTVRGNVRSYDDAVVQVELLSDVGAVRINKRRGRGAYCQTPLKLNEILERVASGALPVDQAEALLDRLERSKKEKP